MIQFEPTYKHYSRLETSTRLRCEAVQKYRTIIQFLLLRAAHVAQVPGVTTTL
eukprot:m.22814 g.22814  ORF g.22814 m.22814 type:complete len:53 (-) comp11298_c0_seq2:1571-1729(-)